LPGCWSQGATEAEALENIREAIREYLAIAAELTQGAEMRDIEVAAQVRNAQPVTGAGPPVASGMWSTAPQGR